MQYNNKTQKVVPIHFTDNQYQKLKQESEKLGSSMASIIRLALNKYLEEGRDG